MKLLQEIFSEGTSYQLGQEAWALPKMHLVSAILRQLQTRNTGRA